MDIREVADRLEIEQVLADYAHAVDHHEWDLFDRIFTADADLDYSEISDRRGNPAAIRAWLSERMSTYRRPYQHLLGTSRITIEGDRATATTPCFNPMPARGHGMRLFGHWYDDELVRTSDGWRIERRRLRPCYLLAVPGTDP